jgi:hypothetical protein
MAFLLRANCTIIQELYPSSSDTKSDSSSFTRAICWQGSASWAQPWLAFPQTRPLGINHCERSAGVQAGGVGGSGGSILPIRRPSLTLQRRRVLVAIKGRGGHAWTCGCSCLRYEREREKELY